MENETEVSEKIIDEVPSIGAPSLKAGIEAILLVVDEPVNAITLAQITNSPEIEVLKTLKSLKNFYFRRVGDLSQSNCIYRFVYY